MRRSARPTTGRATRSTTLTSGEAGDIVTGLRGKRRRTKTQMNSRTDSLRSYYPYYGPLSARRGGAVGGCRRVIVI